MSERCNAELGGLQCEREAGHKGQHKDSGMQWPKDRAPMPDDSTGTIPTDCDLCNNLRAAYCEKHGCMLHPATDTPAAQRDEYVIVACYDCGLAYGSEGWIECIVPHDVWCEISPTHNEGGILCVTCIARRLKRAGRDRVPVMLCGTEAIVVAGQSEAFDRGWKVAEKRIRELDAALLAARRHADTLRSIARRLRRHTDADSIADAMACDRMAAALAATQEA